MRKTSLTKTLTLSLFFIALIGGGLFLIKTLLFAPVEVVILTDPEGVDASLRINRGEVVQFAGETLVELQQGKHLLEVAATGYEPWSDEISVLKADSEPVKVTLEPLPGLLSVVTTNLESEEGVAGIPVTVNGSPAGSTPVEGLALPPGEATIELDLPPDYIAVDGNRQVVQLEGLGNAKVVEILLQTNTGKVAILSRPSGATVINESAGGHILGVTPVEVELPASFPQELVVNLGDDYRPWRTSVILAPGEEQTLGPHVFQKKPFSLNVVTEPVGATILVDGVPKGTSPVELEVPSGEPVEVRATKANYADVTRVVPAIAGQKQDLSLRLPSLRGTLLITSEPEGVAVFINETLEGLTPLEKEYDAGAHVVTLKLPGHPEQTHNLEVHEDSTTRKHVNFNEPETDGESASGKKESLPPFFEAFGGIKMVLVEAGTYQRFSDTGAEPARITISEPFYVSVTEIDNASWELITQASGRKLQRNNFDMTLPDYPVVRVNWKEAVRFCNLLSGKHDLEPGYDASGELIDGLTPNQLTAFRLPTEAEFDYLLRIGRPNFDQSYIWGEQWPPPAMSGNFADAAAERSGITRRVLKGYEDGFPLTAPADSYSDQGPGIKNLVGNVMEWCHDSFSNVFHRDLYGEDSTDPVCTEGGSIKVVKGGSYLSALPSHLDINFRASKGKAESADDLGFRIVLPAAGMRILLSQ